MIAACVEEDLDSDNDDLGNGLNVLSELCIVYKVQIESVTGMYHLYVISLVLYCTPVSCCIVLLTYSAQTGCDINQTRRWVSVMPRPLVKPPLSFTRSMMTCSMTRLGESPDHNRSDLRTTWIPWLKCLETSGSARLGESPDHNRSDLRTTWIPWLKCLETSGWVSGSLCICCKYTYVGISITS